MKQLAEFLTKNPLIVVSMFVFTLLSTVAGLLVSWNDLYKDYLSKAITVPAWSAMLIVVVVFFGWVLYGARKKTTIDVPMELIASKEFGVERVFTSGKRFLSCKFDGTEIIFDGRATIGFENCRFVNQRFTFDGAAALTLAVLTAMYKDPTFRPMIDVTLQNIKTGVFPSSPSPSSKQ